MPNTDYQLDYIPRFGLWELRVHQLFHYYHTRERAEMVLWRYRRRIWPDDTACDEIIGLSRNALEDAIHKATDVGS